MKKLFPGFYQPTDTEFKKLWEKCTFVIDANVLLNLYRYPEEAKADLLKVFGKISDRLWLPYQAALEYQKNRLIVIAEQRSRKGDRLLFWEHRKVPVTTSRRVSNQALLAWFSCVLPRQLQMML